jgi:hypothetical protein
VPFQSSAELRAFCDDRILFPSIALADGMGEEGIEFLVGLLKPQPLERPTATKALHHNWLQFDGISDEVVVDASEMQHILSPQASQVKFKPQKPIKFKDCVERKFLFPFHLCQTWAVSLIAFQLQRPHVVC